MELEINYALSLFALTMVAWRYDLSQNSWTKRTITLTASTICPLPDMFEGARSW